jgi:DtxR family Mn-dependent transcriptional regulator
MVVWKEFDENEVTHSAAHHLMAVDQVGRNYGGWARVSDIARHLNITRGSVSINLRSLAARGLIEQDEHHMVRLTAQGQQIVQGIHANKAVLHAFMRDVLGLSDKQADVDSCKIEHLISNQTARQLARLIHFLHAQDADAVKKFKAFKDRCYDPKTCPICKTVQAAGHNMDSVLQHLQHTQEGVNETIGSR